MARRLVSFLSGSLRAGINMRADCRFPEPPERFALLATASPRWRLAVGRGERERFALLAAASPREEGTGSPFLLPDDRAGRRQGLGIEVPGTYNSVG